MRRGMFLLTCVLMIGVIDRPMTWAGGVGNSTPAVREALLAHICTAGPNQGQPCAVHWVGPDPYNVVSDDCPGACVIDYESEPFEGEFFVMVDDHVAAPSEPETVLEVPIVTALLCVEVKKKEAVLGKREDVGEKDEKKEGKKIRHCITDSYRPTADGSFVFGGVGLSTNPNPEEHLVSSATEGLADSPPGIETLRRFWTYSLFEVLTPESDLTQALRDLYKKTGVVTVVDIRRIGTDDHVEDTTGSVLRFLMKLQFVKAPLLGP